EPVPWPMSGAEEIIVNDSVRNAKCCPIAVASFVALYWVISSSELWTRSRKLGDTTQKATLTAAATRHAPNTPFNRANRQPSKIARTGATPRTARLNTETTKKLVKNKAAIAINAHISNRRCLTAWIEA